MASLEDRRQSIYHALQALSNWNVYQYLHSAPDVPALMVGAPPQGSLDEDFDDGASYTFTILAIGPGDDWPTAQMVIDPLLAPSGDGSLKDALDDEADLNGQIGEVTFSDYGPGIYAGANCFGVKFTMEVIG